MDQKQRDFLAAQLAAMEPNDRHKLRERAAKARKAAIARNKSTIPSRWHNEEDDFDERRPKTPPLDEWMVKLLREEVKPDAAASNVDPNLVATVIAVHRRACEVVRGSERFVCELKPELAAVQQAALAVGDRIQVEDRVTKRFVGSILPRTTKLARPDPGAGAKERVVVANVDIVVVVVSVQSPPLHPKLIDRYLIAIGRGGAEAVIAVNKSDLVELDHPDFDLLRPYRLVAPVIRCSAASGLGLIELREALGGKRSAFVGHSGVGKSSLLNALKPDLELEVGAVSEGYGRGRHTTTSSHLWDLGDGTEIIDTPGVRSFGLFSLRREELPYYFPEFVGTGCRFRDCTHTVEPGCGVAAAVESGDISADRLETYRRIYRGLKK